MSLHCLHVGTGEISHVRCYLLLVEGQSDCLVKQASVFVIGSIAVNSDVATWNHLWRVPARRLDGQRRMKGKKTVLTHRS